MDFKSLSEMALSQPTGLLPGALSMLGLRIVSMENPYFKAWFVIVGVMPFRALKISDLYNKYVVSLKEQIK